MPSCTSPRVSVSTLPISRVIARAIASFRWTSSSPTRCSTWPRIGAGVLDHRTKPRRADSIAFSMSAGPERGNRPITSFQSAGLRFSKYSPVEGATHSPAMKFLKVSGMSGLGAEERCGNLGVADARQHFARGEHETPDDKHLGQQVRKPEAPAPRREAAPDARNDQCTHADEVEDQFEAAAVRVWPGHHPDAQEHAEWESGPRAQSLATARQGSWRSPPSGAVGHMRLRDPRHGRHAAPQRRIGVRQLSEELVDLPHLAVPVPILLLAHHYAPPFRPNP